MNIPIDSDQPILEVTSGDEVDIPLTFVEGDAEDPINFATGDLLRMEIKVNAKDASAAVTMDSPANITFVDGTNVATLLFVAATLSALEDDKRYVWGFRRKRTGKFRTLVREGIFYRRVALVQNW